MWHHFASDKRLTVTSNEFQPDRALFWGLMRAQLTTIVAFGLLVTGLAGVFAGLVAVDFRAGLTLLPFLPMSPGDFKLIFTGLARGSLVQFDRGSIDKLEKFIKEHNDDFSDMYEMLDELKESEHIYRNSVPDITHNHFRLFYSSQLWSTIIKSMINAWKIQNIIDEFDSLDNFKANVTREWLINQKGFGYESSDSVLCYFAYRDVMVVDNYTLKLLKKLGF
jgi:hypothetical protein